VPVPVVGVDELDAGTEATAAAAVAVSRAGTVEVAVEGDWVSFRGVESEVDGVTSVALGVGATEVSATGCSG